MLSKRSECEFFDPEGALKLKTPDEYLFPSLYKAEFNGLLNCIERSEGTMQVKCDIWN